MRIALLADVHSNLAALRAVLDHAEAERAIDRIWLLGDTVGYGPQPNECVALLRRYPQEAVAGNHDLAALGRLDPSDFNTVAREAAAWTGRALDDVSRAYLEAMPEVIEADAHTLVHGTLRDPVIEYLYTPEVALAHLRLQKTALGFVGHTHVPATAMLAGLDATAAVFRFMADGESLATRGLVRAVVNPGGVGQPRDGDPRAAYALFDDEAGVVTFHRVPYDIVATQRAMERAGLPRPLIERLARGR